MTPIDFTQSAAREASPGLVKRFIGLSYAGIAFLGTWVFFTWFVVFLGNFPRRSDPWLSPSADIAPEADPVVAVLANLSLIFLFCLQHSVMARPAFKRWIARVIPAPLERATYVHAANIAGFLLLHFWTPMPTPLWIVESRVVETAIWIAFGAGWLILLWGALSINVFELLGLEQAWRWYRGQDQRPLKLKTSWLYRYVEHPMYVGVLLGIWMTPCMSVGRALLGGAFTFYIALAMLFERRDLQTRFGQSYADWRGEQRSCPFSRSGQQSSKDRSRAQNPLDRRARSVAHSTTI